MIRLLIGDCRTILPTLPAQSVHCCVTSPPYFGLRDYGTAIWEGGDAECNHKQGRNGSGRADGVVDDRGQRNRDGVGSMGGDCPKCGATRIDSQIGLEPTPQAYVEQLVAVFRDVRRVLRDDGTLWLNLGDSYCNPAQSGGGDPTIGKRNLGGGTQPKGKRYDGLKPKDLIGIPWRVAFALQADGWYLRQDIIWSKPNPMPESVTDRCTKAHEYIFLLSKNARYYYDADAIAEQAKEESADRYNYAFSGAKKGQDAAMPLGYSYAPKGMRSLHMRETPRKDGWRLVDGGVSARGIRNKRSVWEIVKQPYSEAHFATFPPALIEPCILAGCPKDGTVLDPFSGAGTTGLVADRLGRKAVLIELNQQYSAMAKTRIYDDAPLFAELSHI